MMNDANAEKFDGSTRTSTSSGTESVYRLTPVEIDLLRAQSLAFGVWARQQLAIDPELKHLGPAGGPAGGGADNP